jgi:hypothetical protein
MYKYTLELEQMNWALEPTNEEIVLFQFLGTLSKEFFSDLFLHAHNFMNAEFKIQNCCTAGLPTKSKSEPSQPHFLCLGAKKGSPL